MKWGLASVCLLGVFSGLPFALAAGRTVAKPVHPAIRKQAAAPTVHRCDSRQSGNDGRFIVLPDGECDWDIQRMEPTVIVIHHTAVSAKMSLLEMSDEQRVRLYHGQESGHYIDVDGKRKEVYWAYHELIRPNGQMFPLLKLDEIGFQADDWGVNRQAIGIALAGNYAHHKPSAAALAELDRSVRDLMLAHPSIKWVVGHDDVRPKLRGRPTTQCPGPWFPGWLRQFEAKYGYHDLDTNPDLPNPPFIAPTDKASR